MKVLLFGGTRFMGRYVIKALLEIGADITIANRGTRVENTGTTNVICDRSQRGSLDQFANSSFDAVIDFSAYASDWVEEAGNYFSGKIDKYIFISSGAVYTASNTFPITENFPKGPPHPFADYAKEKMRSETLLRELSSKGNFQSSALRLPFVLGPDNYEDRESFVFSRLLNKSPIYLANGGKSIHSFIYAGDVARAIVKILTTNSRTSSEEYNVAILQGTTSRGFVEQASDVCGIPADIVSYQPEDFQLDSNNFDLKNVAFPFPEHNSFLASQKILDSLKFVPKFNLKEMLTAYYEWWLKESNTDSKEYPLENRIKEALSK